MTTMNGYEDYQKDFQGYQDNIDNVKSGMRYFVFAISNGKWVNIGYKMSEAEATEMAFQQVPDKQWEIFATNTSDIAECHRRWKKHLLERNHNLDQATSLISRKPAQEQKKRERGFLDS
jgi:acyl-CoA reductase-like NAD-dependent aldehyde dehydrogenase